VRGDTVAAKYKIDARVERSKMRDEAILDKRRGSVKGVIEIHAYSSAIFNDQKRIVGMRFDDAAPDAGSKLLNRFIVNLNDAKPESLQCGRNIDSPRYQAHCIFVQVTQSTRVEMVVMTVRYVNEVDLVPQHVNMRTGIVPPLRAEAGTAPPGIGENPNAARLNQYGGMSDK